MALQNVIEKLYLKKWKDKDALVWAVKKAWRYFTSIELNNIWKQWQLVIDLITNDTGSPSQCRDYLATPAKQYRDVEVSRQL